MSRIPASDAIDAGVATGIAAVVAIVFAGFGFALSTLIGTPTPTPTITVTAPPVTLPAPPPKTVTVTREVRVSRSTPRAKPKVSAPKGDAQRYARSKVSAAQWPCLRDLWQKESGWRTTANNPTSSAYGIPQILGLREGTGYRYQVDRGLAYIGHRYGTPCRAWAHFRAVRWY